MLRLQLQPPPAVRFFADSPARLGRPSRREVKEVRINILTRLHHRRQKQRRPPRFPCERTSLGMEVDEGGG